MHFNRLNTQLDAMRVRYIFLQMARETLDWISPYKTVSHGSFEFGDTAWFPEGGSLSHFRDLRRLLTFRRRAECKLQLCRALGIQGSQQGQ